MKIFLDFFVILGYIVLAHIAKGISPESIPGLFCLDNHPTGG